MHCIPQGDFASSCYDQCKAVICWYFPSMSCIMAMLPSSILACDAQRLRRPSTTYMESFQTDITAQMRAILVDWMIEVAQVCLSPHMLTCWASFWQCILQHAVSITRHRPPHACGSVKQQCVAGMLVTMLHGKFSLSHLHSASKHHTWEIKQISPQRRGPGAVDEVHV